MFKLEIRDSQRLAKQMVKAKSRKKRKEARALLFEGRSALHTGLNLTLVSIPFVQKHFLG